VQVQEGTGAGAGAGDAAGSACAGGADAAERQDVSRGEMRRCDRCVCLRLVSNQQHAKMQTRLFIHVPYVVLPNNEKDNSAQQMRRINTEQRACVLSTMSVSKGRVCSIVEVKKQHNHHSTSHPQPHKHRHAATTHHPIRTRTRTREGKPRRSAAPTTFRFVHSADTPPSS
jgi:hypothetical protein